MGENTVSKQKNLNLDPQHPKKSDGMAHNPRVEGPRTGRLRLRQEDHWGLLASQPNQKNCKIQVQ